MNAKRKRKERGAVCDEAIRNSIPGGWSPQPSALNLICGLGQTVWKMLYYKKIGEILSIVSSDYSIDSMVEKRRFIHIARLHLYLYIPFFD